MLVELLIKYLFSAYELQKLDFQQQIIRESNREFQSLKVWGKETGFVNTEFQSLKVWGKKLDL